MTRKKVKLAFMMDASARKASFMKRKKGLMKKVEELSTLCGIDACAIVYSPYEPQPAVWPNNNGVERVLAQFKQMPEMLQTKNMVNLESLIRQRIKKTNQPFNKQIKENREKEMTEVMYQYLRGKGSIANLNLPNLNDLGVLVDQTMEEICWRIESLKNANTGQGASSAPLLQIASTVDGNRSSDKSPMVYNMGTAVDGVQRFPDWFNDPSGQNQGFCRGYEISQFLDHNPNHFFP